MKSSEFGRRCFESVAERAAAEILEEEGTVGGAHRRVLGGPGDAARRPWSPLRIAGRYLCAA
jgi:hypothetical protein